MLNQSGPSSVAPPSLNVFRVKRKRNADPLEALIVSIKRPKIGFSAESYKPVLFHLSATSEVPDVTALGEVAPGTQFNIIDFDPSVEPSVSGSTAESLNGEKGENLLKMLAESDIEASPSVVNDKSNSNKNREITLNGVPMAAVDVPNEAENYLFDFYFNPIQFDSVVIPYLVRAARSDELDLYCDEDTESSAEADDDDDSNSENNWRNDYPDEESYSSSNSDTDDEDYDEDPESFDDLNHRFDNCGIEYSDDDDDY